MKKILYSIILIVLISIALSAEGLEDSLVSDAFNDEYLSEKWSEIYEGNGGTITEEYSTVLDNYIKFTTTNPEEPPYVYNDAKVGIYREFPSKIIDLLNTGPGEFRVTLIRYPDESNGENRYGALRIDFGNNRFLEVRQSREKNSNTNKYHRIQRYYNENGFIYESYSVGTYSYEPTGIVIEKRINGHYYVKDVYEFEETYIDVGKIPDIQSISLYSYAEVPNNAGTSMSSFECYPDLNDLFEVTYSPNRLYYEQDNFLHVNVNNYYTGDGFNGAEITILNHNFQNVYGPEYVESDGTFNITLHPQKGDSIKYYMIAENTHYVGQIDTFEIPIITRQLFYECSEEIPAINNTEYEVFVYEEEILPYPEGTVKHPINDAYVSLSNGYDIEENGYTGADGKILFNLYTKYTDDIHITIDKDGGYISKTDKILPYVWSRTSNAFGKNNQTNIVRETGSDNTAMVYSLGDTIVFGVSDDFGKTWMLDYVTYDHDDNPATEETIATGENPVITELSNGYMIVWKDDLYLKYAVKTSPWVVDTLNSQPTLWHSEAVLNQSIDNTMKYGVYISHRTLDPEGELIFLMINSDNGGVLSADTMIKKDGSDGAIPKNSPFVAGYIQETDESYLAGCIDMEDQVAFRRWDLSILGWRPVELPHISNNPCLNPSIDFNGSNTTFVWEEINNDNTKDIWDYKLTPNGEQSARNLSAAITPGVNRYPKNRDNILYNYINNANTMIDYRDGFSSEINPISYTLYEGNDSLHSYSVNVKKEQFRTNALYSITEGSNSNYRIKFITKRYDNEVWYDTKTEPTDTTIIDATDSPISNYVNGNFKVERLSAILPVIDNNMENIVKLITDDKNPHVPQVIMIDGEVMGVIYGGNEVKETDIEIPSYMRDDNTITVIVDRMKGNPNRTIEIALYEYETEGEVQTVNNNRIAFNQPTIDHKPSTFDLSIDHKLSTINLNYSIPKTGHINFRIFDAAGRVIETVRNGSVNQGNYTYTPKRAKSGVYFAVMEYEGNVYKEKFIILK